MGVVYLIFILACVLAYSIAAEKQWLYQSEGKWDTEWSSGAWEYQDIVAVERSRTAIIGSVFAQMYAPKNGSLLDIGCGEGIISDYLLPEQKAHYVGVDISKEAIKLAKSKRKSPQKFVHAAAHQFVPQHKFDVIVFSEVLYYVEHEKVLNQYAKFLNPNGIIIISIFHTTDKIMYPHIYDYARTTFNKVDEIDVGGYTRKTKGSNLEKTACFMEVYKLKK